MNNIILPSYIQDTLIWKDSSRFQWWIDLVMNASQKEQEIDTCIGLFKCEIGQIATTLSELSRRWNTTKDNARNYLTKLERNGFITKKSLSNITIITICKFQDYIVRSVNNTKVTPINDCNIEDSCKVLHVNSTKGNIIDKSACLKGRNNTEITPINDCNTEALKGTLHESYTKPKKKKEENRKERSKEKNKEERINITTRTREKSVVSKAKECFENYFNENYGNSYYWTAKDAVNMKQLLKKITFSRSKRNKPLPVDDDSLIEALGKFLPSINKEWIGNNFSVSKINSYYNEIISEIKNGKDKKNSLSAGSRFSKDNWKSNEDRIASQKANILADIAKAETKWKRGEINGDET